MRAGSTVQCGGRPMDGDELNRRIEEICTERGLTFAPWECPPWECDEGPSPWPADTAGAELWPKAQRLRRQLIAEINNKEND